MISRETVSLPMIMGSIYALEMGSITVNQIPQLLFGKKRLSLTNRAALPLVRPGYLHTITRVNFYKKINGTSVWSPVFTYLQENEVRTVFETAGGTVFIGSDNGLFKSTNSGKTWKQVHNGGWVMKLVESNGVLLATSGGGILRSTDDGENWNWVISEGGVGIAVERIDGGFAAISCNTSTQSRRIHISLDRGKTWKTIDEGLQPSLLISSIKQMGDYLLCGHPDGIFRSSDMGKTWKLILPSIGSKVFNVSVSGKVIYAIPRNGGC
jgi:photosystem II stability/assembly factor-like uncharacterized protein